MEKAPSGEGRFFVITSDNDVMSFDCSARAPSKPSPHKENHDEKKRYDLIKAARAAMGLCIGK